MKAKIQQLVAQALRRLTEEGVIPDGAAGPPAVERARDPAHGDFATNAAMVLAKAAGTHPRALAARIVAALPPSDLVAGADVAGPGFINFRLAAGAHRAVVAEALAQGPAFGRGDVGQGRRVQVEFVSANPTGPLHVGHGRGAAYGATVASLLEAVGFAVHREYYVNDAGRQMDILAAFRRTAIAGTTSGTSLRRCTGSMATPTATVRRRSSATCRPTLRPRTSASSGRAPTATRNCTSTR